MSGIIDRDRDSLIESVRDLVRIRSVREEPLPGAPFGPGLAEALKRALEIAGDLGFETVDLDGYVGYAEHGSGDDYVAVLGHLDVVPEGDGWTHPPYAAEVHRDRIYGRGTTDDKGPVMAALYALKAVRDSGLPLSKRVRVIFGTDEESENADIPHYLGRERPPCIGFTPDAFYPLVYAEKGIVTLDLVADLDPGEASGMGIERDIEIDEDPKIVGDTKIDVDPEESSHTMTVLRIHGGVAANMVPDTAEAEIAARDEEALIEACQGYAKRTGMALEAKRKGGLVYVKSAGVAAHGSTPEEGKNAIMQLLAFLDTLPLSPSGISGAVSFLNKAVDMETDGSSFGLAMEDEPSGKLSLNLGMVRTNESDIAFTLNIRYPVTTGLEDVMAPLRDRISGTGFRIENPGNQNPLYFPKDSPLVETLMGVFEKETGYKGEPLAIGGGTYAKEMPNILAFGPIFPGEPMVEHRPDEYIKIDDLVLNCKIYAHAIYELAR